MLHRIHPLLLFFLALPALHAAHADPRFGDVPVFWPPDARITFLPFMDEPESGVYDGVHLHFPAPAHPERIDRLEVHLDEDFLLAVPPTTTEVQLEFQSRLHGTWRIQPVLADGRLVGMPLVTVLPPEQVGVAAPPALGSAPSSGLLDVMATGSEVDQLFANPSDDLGLGDLPGSDATGGFGLIGTRAGSGMRSGNTGNTGGGGVAGFGSLGGSTPPGRFDIALEETAVSGPTPPPREDVAGEALLALRQATPCVQEALGGRLAVLTLTLVAPADAPLETRIAVAAPAGADALPASTVSAVRACVDAPLAAAPFADAGFGWQATVTARWHRP